MIFFVWNPVTILSVVGLASLWRRNRELAGIGLAGLALLIVANCTVRDWWGGSAFGMRRLISATPLLVTGLAVLLDDARLALTRERPQASGPGAGTSALRNALLPALLTMFALWNGLLLAQYGLGMISHDGPVPFTTVAANHPRVAIRLLQLGARLLH